MHAQCCPAQVEAVTSAALSPTPDWRDKVLWLVGDLGYPRRVTCGRELAEAHAPAAAVQRLAWLQGQRFPIPWGEVLEGAAAAGRQGLVAWVLSEARGDRGARVWGEQQQQQLGGGGLGAAAVALAAAARAGQVEVLRELFGAVVGLGDGMGCAGRDVFAAAVEGGQMEAAAWLDAQGAGLVLRAGKGAGEAWYGWRRGSEQAQPQPPHWDEERNEQERAQGQEPALELQQQGQGQEPALERQQGQGQEPALEQQQQQQGQPQQGQGGDQGGPVADERKKGGQEQEQEEGVEKRQAKGQELDQEQARKQEQERQRLGQLFLGAVSSGSMDMVRWLERRAVALGWGGAGRLAGAGAWQEAAAVGCGEVVEWLAASGCRMPVGGLVGAGLTVGGALPAQLPWYQRGAGRARHCAGSAGERLCPVVQ